ncbi:MAG: DUF4350 domain-containing protein, partial [Myxococcota bacterium]
MSGGERWWVWGIGVAGVVVIAVWMLLAQAPAAHRAAQATRSTSSAPHGTRALALIAARLGRPPQRVTYPMKVLSQQATGTLFVIAPQPQSSHPLWSRWFAPPTGDPWTLSESDAMVKWIAQGNTIVVVHGSDAPFLARFGLALRTQDDRRMDQPGWITARPEQPDRFRGVVQVDVERSTPEIVWSKEDAEVPGPLEITPLLVLEPDTVDAHARCIAVQVVWRGGQLIWISSPELVSNRGLARGDNGLWLARLLLLNPHQALFIDEFHHGMIASRSPLRYAVERGLWGVLLQLGLVVVVMVWRLGYRFGQPYAPPPGPSWGGTALAETLGGVYQQGGHRDHALKVLLEGLERALVAHFRLPTALQGDALCAALHEAGHEPEAKRLAGLQKRVRNGQAFLDTAH